MRTIVIVSALLLAGCPRKASSDSPDAATVASAAPMVDAAAPIAVVDAAPPPVVKAAADAGHSAITTAMKPPTPTSDRFARNRDKDGPCPKGFTEQPGVENHSWCAKNCQKDADCTGHTCADSEVGDGKTCSDIASKTKPAAHTCKSNEIDDGDRCLKQCTKDSDCPKGVKCTSMMVPNPNGGSSTALVCQ
jgi:hypothetical protein